MKKNILLLIVWLIFPQWLVSQTVNRLARFQADLRPRVMPTQLPSDDVPIASLNVTEAPFNAQNDGSKDATAAFQAAIDSAANAGGAVVFVPAGRYRFDGNLVLREGVTLRGDWQSPEKNPAVQGTILMPTAGQGQADGTPFLQLERGSGMRNLSIWYPNQSAPHPTPYPWTILCNPPSSTGDNTSVVNVTLVNPYRAIKVGPEWNELHTIRHVYGTPLKAGIWLSYTTDIGRIEDVHFEPTYWAQSGLTGAPTESAILEFTQANGEGLAVGRSDWEYIFDVSLVGYHTGIHIFRDPSHGTPNGVIYGARIEKSHVGLQIDETNGVGFIVEASAISASAGLDPLCVEAGTRFSSVVEFNSCTFGGKPEFDVFWDPASTGRLTFQNCSFANWEATMDSAAIYTESGSLALLGCMFQKNAPQIHLGKKVSTAWILNNTFAGGKPRIRNESRGEVFMSPEELHLKKLDVSPHPYRQIPRPATEDLFNVGDYGAIGDGKTDDTAAFQAALDAAEQNGGGTVYIPAGWYKIAGHLRVPSGVELRGIWDVPHHTVSHGSVLLVIEGKGNPDGTPFIALETGAGARGFTLWYPEQTTDTFDPYPWAIRAQGPRCWVKDVVIGNAYQGVDFGSFPSDGHVISYVGGSPLKRGIYISKNSGEGWLENVQFNPHYWLRSPGYPKAREPDFQTLMAYQQAHLDAFTLGVCEKEHVLGTFVYAANRGFYLANEGAPCHADVFLHGTDAGSYGVFLNSPEGSVVNFMASQLVLLGATPNGIVASGNAFAGEANFYGVLAWGSREGPTAAIEGTGRVLLQQVHTDNGVFRFNGGTVRVENSVIRRKWNPQFIVGPDVKSVKITGVWAKGGFKMENHAGDRVKADYNFQQSRHGVELKTGWDDSDPPDDWENTLYGLEVHQSPGMHFQCAAETSDSAHSGKHVLAVSAEDLPNPLAALYFKIFRVFIPVYSSTELSYFLRPKDDGGRGVHIDLLFTDGTRLSDFHPVASDSLPLTAARGEIGTWQKVVCPVGKYAAGRTVQEILVGAQNPLTTRFHAFLDDLTLETAHRLPEGWQDVDVGHAAPPGFAVFDRGSFLVTAGGYGLVGYANDAFHFVFKKIRGDATLTARVDQVEDVGGTAFAGIMMRGSTAGKAPFFAILAQPRYGVFTKWRAASGASIQSRGHREFPPKPPLYVRLVRKGNQVASFCSSDGTTWTGPLFQTTIVLDSTVLVGLAASPGPLAERLSATFSQVSVVGRAVNVATENKSYPVPTQFELKQNYPNPFVGETKINYTLPVQGRVKVVVYNLAGERVRTFLRENQTAGVHTIRWDGRDTSGARVPSGVYYCVVQAGKKKLAKKMIVLH